MAITVKSTWFGLQYWIDEDTVIELLRASVIGDAAALEATIALALTGFVPAAMVSLLIGGILALGADVLRICDSAHRGVVITVPWVAVPWCFGR